MHINNDNVISQIDKEIIDTLCKLLPSKCKELRIVVSRVAKARVIRSLHNDCQTSGSCRRMRETLSAPCGDGNMCYSRLTAPGCRRDTISCFAFQLLPTIQCHVRKNRVGYYLLLTKLTNSVNVSRIYRAVETHSFRFVYVNS